MNLRFDTRTGDVNFGVKFEKRDCWIGLYWNHAWSVESTYQVLELYLCIIPFFPLYCFITWGWRQS
jgi:hypothetical protein